ncbi:hypothetical protein CYMTET_5337 [Cymbomonas tetramitiformis]|uniref:Uncharacterized protein n=1 Tax=Cymbomonas tetramitiformis TaxID=36881 RepID=A0AAE0GZM6_9CHLO|nr:hypothetical protein CYMTET_5337 [Cymbomonas tetramitiformis]
MSRLRGQCDVQTVTVGQHSINVREEWGGVVTTTGGRTWSGSLILAEWMLEHEHLFAGKQVLELGSGTGLCGFLASRLGGRVTLSDGEESVVENLKKTAVLNQLEASCHCAGWFHSKESAAQAQPLGSGTGMAQPLGSGNDRQDGTLRVAQLEWGCATSTQAQPRATGSPRSDLERSERFDTVLGCEVLYTAAQVEPLAGTLHERLTGTGMAALMLGVRDRVLLRTFLAQVEQRGLVATTTQMQPGEASRRVAQGHEADSDVETRKTSGGYVLVRLTWPPTGHAPPAAPAAAVPRPSSPLSAPAQCIAAPSVPATDPEAPTVAAKPDGQTQVRVVVERDGTRSCVVEIPLSAEMAELKVSDLMVWVEAPGAGPLGAESSAVSGGALVVDGLADAGSAPMRIALPAGAKEDSLRARRRGKRRMLVITCGLSDLCAVPNGPEPTRTLLAAGGAYPKQEEDAVGGDANGCDTGGRAIGQGPKHSAEAPGARATPRLPVPAVVGAGKGPQVRAGAGGEGKADGAAVVRASRDAVESGWRDPDGGGPRTSRHGGVTEARPERTSVRKKDLPAPSDVKGWRAVQHAQAVQASLVQRHIHSYSKGGTGARTTKRQTIVGSAARCENLGQRWDAPEGDGPCPILYGEVCPLQAARPRRRVVVDGVASPPECRTVIGGSILAMEGLPWRRGETALVASEWATLQQWMTSEGAQAVVTLVGRTAKHVRDEFGETRSLFLAGAQLTRLQPPTSPPPDEVCPAPMLPSAVSRSEGLQQPSSVCRIEGLQQPSSVSRSL